MASVVTAAQHPLTSPTWAIRFDPVWDILGPFPIHAREQHFLNPAYPINLSEPIDYTKSWPSAFADNATVTWSTTFSDPVGALSVSFPEIRWERLRATEGWAALQHHAVLHTTLTLQQIGGEEYTQIEFPHIRVSLEQASYFSLRPKRFHGQNPVPRWYPGNIYAMERSEPISIQLPPSELHNGMAEYDLFVSGDYEIRLFGDPAAHEQQFPTQQIRVGIDILPTEAPIIHHSLQDIICDFVDGWAFGTTFGVSVSSTSEWWSLDSISLASSRYESFSLYVPNPITLAPHQTRVVAITISQDAPFYENLINFSLHWASHNNTFTMNISLPLFHRRIQDWDKRHILRATSADPVPFQFIAIPPVSRTRHPYTPVVALHGAGVDVISQDFWANALPNNTFNWVIVPVGGTSWGLDWHGPSASDVNRTIGALRGILVNRPHFSDRSLPNHDKIVLIGHSNGGQGTWYYSSRHPDRVIAAVPAAAYIKSQAYIPLTLSRGKHFADPILQAILESALTPDDNDLYTSNLVKTYILAIHGGNDDNVPTWHTRELVASLRTWYPDANIQFHEDPGQGHWYPDVFRRHIVQEFVDSMIQPKQSDHSPPNEFTLTSAYPQEASSLYGWCIEQLKVPGRLGRLRVRFDGAFARITTSNVRAFSITPTASSSSNMDELHVHVDGNVFAVNTGSKAIFSWNDLEHAWQWVSSVSNPAPTRIQSILSSRGPLILIISSSDPDNARSAASRIAFAMHVYHRLDAEIIQEEDAIERDEAGAWAEGNIVFIGPPGSKFAQRILSRHLTPVAPVDAQWISIGDVQFKDPGHAALFLHPHPRSDNKNALASMLFMTYNEQHGLERVLRLFPYRTGVPIPSWLVVSEQMDRFGVGGIEAAGVWGTSWEINPQMTWFRE